MRKLTQKLVLSVVTMALVVVALGTSTFAWFTLTNEAQLGSFEGQIVAGTGIEVSLDNYRWFNGLTTKQMEDYLFDGGFPQGPSGIDTAKYGTGFRWNAITSKNGINMINLDESDAANSSFIEFTLYFRSEAAGTINWTSVLLGGAAKSWVPDATFVGSTGETVTVGNSYNVFAKNGARVSVTGSVSSVATTVIYQLPPETSSTSVSGNQTTFGHVTGGQAKYWEAKNPGQTFADFVEAQLTDNSVTPYEVPATDSGEAFEAAAAAVTTLGSGVPVLTLAAPSAGSYSVGSVTIRVWLDGWDADTFNALFNAYLSASLEFKVV